MKFRLTNNDNVDKILQDPTLSYEERVMIRIIGDHGEIEEDDLKLLFDREVKIFRKKVLVN